MLYRLGADAVVLIHLVFIGFVVLGGLLVARRPWIARVHLPAVAWAALVEFQGWICPLTPLENLLRQRAGEAAYTGDFVARYLLPLIYPAGLTRTTQVLLGAGVVVLNALVYAALLRNRWRH